MAGTVTDYRKKPKKKPDTAPAPLNVSIVGPTAEQIESGMKQTKKLLSEGKPIEAPTSSSSAPTQPTITRMKDGSAYVETPDGKILRFTSMEDAQGYVSGWIGERAVPQGAMTGEEYQTQLSRQQAGQLAAEQLGAPRGMMAAEGGIPGQPKFGEAGLSSIDWRQTMLAAAADPSVWTSIAGGAIGASFLGAKLGAAGGPYGIVAGAILGGILGVYKSVKKNIDSQKTDDINAQKYVLTDGRTNLMQLVSLMNMDPDNGPIYVDLFNQQLNQIQQAYSQLKLDSNNDLSLALSLDGRKQLQRYYSFYAPGGGYDVYTARAREALGAPNSQIGMMQLMMSQENIGGEEE